MIRSLRSVQFSSVAQSCPTLWDPMNRSMPGLPIHQRSNQSKVSYHNKGTISCPVAGSQMNSDSESIEGKRCAFQWEGCLPHVGSNCNWVLPQRTLSHLLAHPRVWKTVNCWMESELKMMLRVQTASFLSLRTQVYWGSPTHAQLQGAQTPTWQSFPQIPCVYNGMNNWELAEPSHSVFCFFFLLTRNY